MLNFNIRLTRAEDAQQLPVIDLKSAQAFRAIDDLSWIADSEMMSIQKHFKFIVRKTSWVAEECIKKAVGTEGGKLLGFICAQPVGANLHIEQLSVDALYQGQGIGKKLIQTCCQYAYDKGYKAVTLTTFRHVPWNMPWYTRLGFKVLNEDELTPELQTILMQEVRNGLVRAQRCAMHKRFEREK